MAFIPVYILILGFTIIVDYFAGILINKSSGSKKKLLLICSLIANIGVLAVFKYYNFLNENLTILLKSFNTHNPIPYLSILLPIGLSFHTFQAMSYTIEVYRGNQQPERNFGIYALYVMFFPQLVAGPIERPQNLLHQFREKHSIDYQSVSDGLRLMIWGFFKKIVIADRLSIYVDSVYNNADKHNGYSLIFATILFSFQIYCDFSGYSDIAIGTAKILGFKLMNNFKRPYFSSSVSEFWSRWHISLSTWFRDYLYISLGGNRVSIPRWYFNLFFVFLISGLWHGANWTFVIWGALNGFYLIAGIITKPFNDALLTTLKIPVFIRKVFAVLITFTLVSFSWIFFRSSSFEQAFLIITKMLHPSGYLFISSASMLVYIVIGLTVLLFVEFRQEFFNFDVYNSFSSNVLIKYSAYITLVLLILLIGVFDGGQFIYFQF